MYVSLNVRMSFDFLNRQPTSCLVGVPKEVQKCQKWRFWDELFSGKLQPSATVPSAYRTGTEQAPCPGGCVAEDCEVGWVSGSGQSCRQQQ